MGGQGAQPAPAGEAQAPATAAAAADAAAAEREAVLRDRIAARTAAVESALQQGRWGEAARALVALRALPDARGTAVAAGLAPMVQRQFESACARLVAAIQEGEIGAAAALLDGWSGSDDPGIDAALAQLAAERGWPRLTGAAGGTAPAVPAAPLPVDRAVRYRVDATVERTRIVRAAGREATLRLVSSRGVSFPTVPVHLLEPEAPTAAEAVALGSAALAAGDVLRARLWCACAWARGGAAAAAELRAALP